MMNNTYFLVKIVLILYLSLFTQNLNLLYSFFFFLVKYKIIYVHLYKIAFDLNWIQFCYLDSTMINSGVDTFSR